jgi:uncharacterized protein
VRMTDVNVLIYAHRADGHPDHALYARWVTDMATGLEPFALSGLVLGAVVRIVSNPRVFKRPSTHDEVFGFIEQLRNRPNARIVSPGPDHWEIFEDLCRRTGATGKLSADAYHAALAIEHGCVWVSTDSDFARFPGLRWEHPFGAR